MNHDDKARSSKLVAMGVDHGESPPRIWSGGIVPQILLCCKILSTRLLAFNVGKCVFCLYSRTFRVSPAMRPPEFQSDLRLCWSPKY